MKGKRSNTNIPKTHPKKVKRSKKFWQQRKTNTICQVPTSESDDDTGSIDENFQDHETITEYQKLLETFSKNERSNQIASDSENENSEESENESGMWFHL